MKAVKNWFLSNEKIAVFFLVLLFVLVRLPGVHLPLHQDEYKWPLIVNPANQSDTTIPHPPLSEFIYKTAGQVVGYNVNFRFVPLFFGAINLILLYVLMRFLYGKRHALLSVFIWIFSYFSVLASLMVDTDGEIMPFFFLLALIGYYRLLEAKSKKEKYFFGFLLVISCLLGFMVKVSFLLAVLAIAADYIFTVSNKIDKKTILKYLVFSVLGVLALFVSLLIAQKLFPFFDLSKSVVYWEHFATSQRNWFQTLIQCLKALLYVSPFLIFFPFFTNFKKYYKVRALVFFILFAFIFYIVLFDFSLGALDRYLQLLILPLTVLSTVAILDVFEEKDSRTKEFVYLGIIVSLVLVWLQTIPHYVPPLHPKSEWISRALSFRWNFLYPFSGGSGPLGFYVSFLFIGLSWVITFLAAVLAKWKKQYVKLVLVFLLPLAVTYNLVFIEEYLVGYFNGYAPGLLKSAIIYIKDNPDIKKVTTYNDNGGNELQEIDKYRKRLYIDPRFDMDEKMKTLNEYKEHYFVLNIPRIDQNSFYQKYFNSCDVVYEKTDRYITGIIYDCRKAPDIKK